MVGSERDALFLLLPVFAVDHMGWKVRNVTLIPTAYVGRSNNCQSGLL